MATLNLDRFDGLDLRDPILSDRRSSMREADNIWIDEGGKVRMRPPLLKLTPALPPETKGLVEIQSQLFTLARKDDGLADLNLTDDGGATVTVKILDFDEPGDANGTWELVDYVVFNGVLVAMIRHFSDSTQFPNMVRLHVFDDEPVTLVSDPYAPTSFAPDQTDPDAEYFEDYEPRMQVSGGKVWISRPDGSIAFSATGLPRVWNFVDTITSLQTLGRPFYFAMPEHVSPNTVDFRVPDIEFDDLILSADSSKGPGRYRWYAAVTQFHDGTDWTPFTEASDPVTNDKEVSYLRDTDGKLIIRLRWDGIQGQRFRFKVILDSNDSDYTGLLNDETIPRVNSGDAKNYSTVWDAPANVGYSIPGNGVFALVHKNLAGEQPLYIETNDDEFTIDDILLIDILGHLWATDGNIFAHDRFIFTMNEKVTHKNGGSEGTAKFRSDSDFASEQFAELAKITGAADAGFIAPKSEHDLTGQVTSMSALKNRIAIHYEDGTVLFQTGGVDDIAFLAYSFVGNGQQDEARSVVLGNQSIIVAQRGVRAFSIAGLNSDNIVDDPIGDAIVRLGILDQNDGILWPHLGLVVMAGEFEGVFQWLVLAFNQSANILAWTVWKTDITDFTIERFSMHVVRDRLYMRRPVIVETPGDTLEVEEGGEIQTQEGEPFEATAASSTSADEIYYFDAAAFDPGGPLFTDDDDVDIKSLIELVMIDMGRPNDNKRFKRFDISQKGESQYGYRHIPCDLDRVRTHINIAGTTHGCARPPLTGQMAGLAFRLESTDETGWELYNLLFDFEIVRR